MSDNIKVKINPFPYYYKNRSCPFILCVISFDIFSGGCNHHFESECNDNCIKKILAETEEFLAGKSSHTELYYAIPWIMGDTCGYPYSFEIKPEKNIWTFRYKKNQLDSDSDFDFVCDLSRDDVISMKLQLKDEYAKIDWDSLGKTPIYTLDCPDKKFTWCYSAKDFCKSLKDLCVGNRIKTLYVSATNYAQPLRVKENYVNYYHGAELLIEMEDCLLDLLIFARGLFKWRLFQKSEYTFSGPTLKFIDNGDEEFCALGNIYDMFTAEYANTPISNVSVQTTDDWPWDDDDFDVSALGNPIELPETIFIHLENNYTLSLHGWDDDFAIKLLPTST